MNNINQSSGAKAQLALQTCGIGHWDLRVGEDIFLCDLSRHCLEIHSAQNIGEQILSKLHPEDSVGFQETQFFQALSNGVIDNASAEKFEFRMQTKDAERVIRITNNVVKEDGRVTRLVGILEDITLIRREFEALLFQTSKMATLGKLTSSIAHEINNPLSIISTYSRVLQDYIARDAEGEIFFLNGLTRIQKMSKRIVKIVKEISFFSGSDELTVFETALLNDVFSETISLSLEECKSKQIQITLHCEQKIEIDCRPVQLSQVLLDLITNSVFAIKDLDERWIRLSARKKNGYVEIAVTDSGKGIGQDLAKKIMTPFFSTKRRGEGSGLGLAISSEIVKRHNGKLYYNKYSENTEFVVEMPLTQAQVLRIDPPVLSGT